MFRLAVILLCSQFIVACGGGSSGSPPPAGSVNIAPVAEGSAYGTSEIADLVGSASATDADGDALTYTVTESPTKGTLTEFDESTGAFTYSPDPTQDGVDSFQFTASDGVATTADATVTIEIFRWSGTPRFATPQWDISDFHDLFIGDDWSLTFGGRAKISAGSSDTDAWLKRVDRRGNELWTRRFDRSVAGSLGGIYENPVGDGFFFLEDTNGRLFYLDDGGDTIWTVDLDFGVQTVDYRGYSGGVDSAGNVYAISSDLASFFITKVSGSTGDVIWQKQFHSSDTNPLDPLIDDSSELVAVGLDFDSADRPIVVGRFAPQNITQSRSCDYCPFVAGIDIDGSPRWVREPDGFKTNCATNNDQGFFFRVAVRNDDTFYASGSSRGGPDLKGQLSFFSADGSEEVWSSCQERTDSDIGIFNRPLPTNDGGVVVFAQELKLSNRASGTVEWEKLYLEKRSSSGELQWVHSLPFFQADGSYAGVSAGTIVGDRQGVMYATFSTDGEVAGFISDPFRDDVYLLRFDSDGNLRE